jgi:hypothetical protein
VAQPRHERFHDDWAVLTRNKFLFKDCLFPSEEEGEAKAKPSTSSKYRKLHLPLDQCGSCFHTLVETLNPLLVLSLLKEDFIQTTTKVKMKMKYGAINMPALVYDSDSDDSDSESDDDSVVDNDPIIGIARHGRRRRPVH